MINSYSGKYIEAGCDEAGRGSLAGPVFAAAVVLPDSYSHSKLNDSKKLSPADRELLRGHIEENALAWAVKPVDEITIDKINISNASFLAMHLAIDDLSINPELLLIDGNRFIPYKSIPHECIIRGDGIYASIAAASILAKTYRDEYMIRLGKQYPVYGWAQNKGYATLMHREAIARSGPCPCHRKSFRIKAVRAKI